ncbi:hypothetical protein LVD17_18320 [Fulvivirga ulvae]|uniref:hypothetical protein n=1 Tax=Fulvivirga ulvae TaxID=2904245 RepID=UPI001F252A0A|nr:hypothetical protein [Fulvivirga ulvae]UII30252.1 hypothetical protein LVD17_18320 [Fulvivirga ulvae]
MICFKEEQALGTVKLWIIMMTVSFVSVMGIVYALYMQLHLKQPLENKLSDTLLVILGVITLLVIAAINWLVLSGRLQTELRGHHIRYRFPPFIWRWKTIKLEDIQQFEISEFKQKRHGYHRSGQRRALSVAGNMALHLTFSSGKKLLLGTQKPKELKKVIEQLMKKETDHG